MAGAQGAGPLDRLLTGIAAIKVLEDGVALEALVDKLDVVGGDVTYTPPSTGQAYGTATVTVNVGAAPGWSVEGAAEVHPSHVAIGALIASYDAGSGILTIEVPLATDSTRGLMSAADKTKLDSLTGDTRTISTTEPLTGGGSLSSDRTIGVRTVSATHPGVVSAFGEIDGPAVLVTNDDATTEWICSGPNAFFVFGIAPAAVPGGSVQSRWITVTSDYIDPSGHVGVLSCSNGSDVAWTESPILTGLFFKSSASTPTIQQSDTIVGNGQNLIVAAQSSTAGGSTGGNVIIDAGAGTLTDGSVVVRSPSRTYCTFSPTTFTCALEYGSNVLFAASKATPTIQQQTISAGNGQNMVVAAQSSSGPLSTGGNLVLDAGAGTSADGSVVIRTPNAVLATFTKAAAALSVDSVTNIRTNAAGYRVVDCQFWFSVSLATGVGHDVVVPGAQWGAVGLLHGSSTTACLFVEVETEHNQNAGPPVRQIFRGHLLANRLTSSTWTRTYDLAPIGSETDPAGAGASLTMTMALSGTQGGDITITVTDANAAAAQSPAMLKVRLLGGWRVA